MNHSESVSSMTACGGGRVWRETGVVAGPMRGDCSPAARSILQGRRDAARPLALNTYNQQQQQQASTGRHSRTPAQSWSHIGSTHRLSVAHHRFQITLMHFLCRQCLVEVSVLLSPRCLITNIPQSWPQWGLHKFGGVKTDRSVMPADNLG